jgi:hypothetical protein
MLAALAAAAAVAIGVTASGHDGRGAGGRPAAGAAVHAPRVAAPRGPRRYRVPRGAVHVATGGQLRAALTRNRRTTIVLAPGSYRGRRPFLNTAGHRLYARRRGSAVLYAGLSLGGNGGRGGAVARGLVVDLRDRARTVDGAAIEIWGVGAGSQVLDTVVRGHGVVASGIVARRPDRVALRRVVARGFTDYGIAIDANEPGRGRLAHGFTVRDVDVAGVARRPAGSSSGRSEACLWLGNTGAVRRARVRDCGSAGLWTGTAAIGVRVADLQVDRAPTGIYLEHFTRDSVFTRVRVGRGVRIGALGEWADPAWDRRPASVDNVIERGLFRSRLAGVYLDEGTTRTTVRGSVFAGQSWGAIGDFRGVANAYYDNDYRALGAGAKAVRHDHLASTAGGGG